MSGNDVDVFGRTARHENRRIFVRHVATLAIAINVKVGELALDVSRVTVTAQNQRFKKNVSLLSLGQKEAVIDRSDDKASMKALTARLTLIAITGARMTASMDTARYQ